MIAAALLFVLSSATQIPLQEPQVLLSTQASTSYWVPDPANPAACSRSPNFQGACTPGLSCKYFEKKDCCGIGELNVISSMEGNCDSKGVWWTSGTFGPCPTCKAFGLPYATNPASCPPTPPIAEPLLLCSARMTCGYEIREDCCPQSRALTKRYLLATCTIPARGVGTWKFTDEKPQQPCPVKCPTEYYLDDIYNPAICPDLPNYATTWPDFSDWCTTFGTKCTYIKYKDCCGKGIYSKDSSMTFACYSSGVWKLDGGQKFQCPCGIL